MVEARVKRDNSQNVPVYYHNLMMVAKQHIQQHCITEEKQEPMYHNVDKEKLQKTASLLLSYQKIHKTHSVHTISSNQQLLYFVS